jgi:hypothetical protein
LFAGGSSATGTERRVPLRATLTASYDAHPMSDPSPPNRPDGDAAKPQAPPLRASDAEREQTAEVLRNAATEGRLDVDELEERLQSAYTVRTRAELELLVADVSVGSITPALSGPTARSSGPPAVREGPGGSRWVISVMSANDRRGRWRIASSCTVINVMGGSELDLCDVELSNQVTRLNVFSVMGGSEIRVPDGVDVHVSKLGFMGGNDVRLGDSTPPVGAPQLRIRLVSIMGGSSVRRGRRLSKAERRQQRELRKAERRDELGP